LWLFEFFNVSLSTILILANIIAGVTVFRKKEEQSFIADAGIGGCMLAITARRQLSRAHVGLKVQEAYPNKATNSNEVTMMVRSTLTLAF
jgi:hypothetical protein